jgi:hypothetical protein
MTELLDKDNRLMCDIYRCGREVFYYGVTPLPKDIAFIYKERFRNKGCIRNDVLEPLNNNDDLKNIGFKVQFKLREGHSISEIFDIRAEKVYEYYKLPKGTLINPDDFGCVKVDENLGIIYLTRPHQVEEIEFLGCYVTDFYQKLKWEFQGYLNVWVSVADLYKEIFEMCDVNEEILEKIMKQAKEIAKEWHQLKLFEPNSTHVYEYL